MRSSCESPVCKYLMMLISYYDANGNVNTEEAFIDYVLEQHAGETVVIVGHSNTVPALVNNLGHGVFEVDELDHGTYDNLFVVSVPAFWGASTLTRTTYGNSSH